MTTVQSTTAQCGVSGGIPGVEPPGKVVGRDAAANCFLFRLTRIALFQTGSFAPAHAARRRDLMGPSRAPGSWTAKNQRLPLPEKLLLDTEDKEDDP
jgi:hypothetical protein